MKFTRLASIALLGALFAASAQAEEYEWSLSGPEVSGLIQVSTAAPLDPDGTAITAISGTLSYASVGPGTFAITGLSPYANANNLAYAAPTAVSFEGVSFTTDTGGTFNLFWYEADEFNPASTYALVASVLNPVGDESQTIERLTLSATQVPEPSAASLLLAGLGAMGLRARRRRPSAAKP